MNIGTFIRTLKKDLAEVNKASVKVVQLKRDQQTDYYFRVSDNEPYQGINFGIDLDIQWRHILVTLSTLQDFVLTGDIFNTFKFTIRENKDSFERLISDLEDRGFNFFFTINNQEYVELHDLPFFDVWHSFNFKVRSRFLRAYDGLEIHYEEFRDAVLLIWNFVELLLFDNNSSSFLQEGAAIDYLGIKYERNPYNRKACLESHGFVCAACGIDMEKIYGEPGRGVIEVHHIQPVSTYEGPQTINPEKDLVPLCPNCHAIAHRRNPPYQVEEIKQMLVQDKNEENNR